MVDLLLASFLIDIGGLGDWLLPCCWDVISSLAMLCSESLSKRTSSSSVKSRLLVKTMQIWSESGPYFIKVGLGIYCWSEIPSDAMLKM